ncbi:MAG TPA: S1C family serine protease [Acetobacteraceae bacterium]|jgi:S1-C subfamily serine protease
MNVPILQTLPQLSDAIVALVAAAAPMVTAIRIGPNRHVTGIVWRADMVVTSDQVLPAQESYSLAMAGTPLVPGRAARRDPATNLASLSLDTMASPAPIRAATDAAVGALALVLGAAHDGSPTVRLTTVHRVNPGQGPGMLGQSIVLDLPGNLLAEGGPVLDARGGLLGMAATGPQGEALVVPYPTIARFLDPLTTMHHQHHPRAIRAAQRGWMGVALQPINVPDTLRPVAGQTSGRMVVSITPSGPAEHAGVRLGDVLLAIDGQSVGGQNALRAYLGPDRIGSTIELKLMREGALRSINLTIASHPPE